MSFYFFLERFAKPLRTAGPNCLATADFDSPGQPVRHRGHRARHRVHIPISSTSGSDPNLPPTPIQTRPLITIRSSHFVDYIPMRRRLIRCPRTARSSRRLVTLRLGFNSNGFTNAWIPRCCRRAPVLACSECNAWACTHTQSGSRNLPS